MSLEETLAGQLLEAHPDEAAAVLEAVDDVSALVVLEGTTSAVAAEIMSQLAPLRATSLLGELEGKLARDVVAHLGLDQSADLVRRMEAEPRTRLLGLLDPGFARVLEDLVQFPEGTAGALMDSRVLALPLDVTAKEAIEQIRQAPENIRYNLYVVDREQLLVGVLNLRELLLADRKATLGSIARDDVMSIQGQEDHRAVLSHPAWREAHSLPVVDRRGVYLGAIRYRTWRRLVEDATRVREQRASPTADALGDLFSTGMEGLLGALTNIAARPLAGGSDGEK